MLDLGLVGETGAPSGHHQGTKSGTIISRHTRFTAHANNKNAPLTDNTSFTIDRPNSSQAQENFSL